MECLTRDQGPLVRASPASLRCVLELSTGSTQEDLSLKKKTIVRFCLSFDVKITLKSHFCSKKPVNERNIVMDVIMFPENL